MEAWEADPEFEDHTITSAKVRDDFIELGMGSMGIGVDADKVPFTVEPGMSIRLFGQGFGSACRGMVIDGKLIYYRTPEEDAIYQKESIYGKDCEELLSRWDEGRAVHTISMGGLGPGYEQVIHLLAFEMLRYLLKHKPDPETWQEPGVWEELRTDIDKSVEWASEKLGCSGSQYGAAMNIATVFYRNGPVKAMEMMKDKERHIMVSKNFPSLS